MADISLFHRILFSSHSEERIRGGVKRLSKQRTTTTQGRLDGFFKVLPKDPAQAKASAAKRKVVPKLKSMMFQHNTIFTLITQG